ncbi:MAG: hypothetical protein ABIY70_19960 [Capsulimonas sp.]|uniref:hypothetical protein n=1 Tax=Capsulimonas sp. TaxID=2494211 RepID=UPI0032632A0A
MNRIFGIYRLIIALNSPWIISCWLTLSVMMIILRTHIIPLSTILDDLPTIVREMKNNGSARFLVIGLQVFFAFSSIRFARLGGSLKENGSLLSTLVFLRPLKASQLTGVVIVFASCHVILLWSCLVTLVLNPLGFQVDLLRTNMALAAQVPLLLSLMWLSGVLSSAFNLLICAPYLLAFADSRAASTPVWEGAGVCIFVVLLAAYGSAAIVEMNRRGDKFFVTNRPVDPHVIAKTSVDAPRKKFPSRMLAYCWFELNDMFWQIIGMPLIACLVGLLLASWIDPIVCLKLMVFASFSGVLTFSDIKLLTADGGLRTFCAVRPMRNTEYASAIAFITLLKILIPASICVVFTAILLTVSAPPMTLEGGEALGAALSLALILLVSWKCLMINVGLTLTGRSWVRPIFSFCVCILILLVVMQFSKGSHDILRLAQSGIVGLAALRAAFLCLILIGMIRRKLLSSVAGLRGGAVWLAVLLLTSIMLYVISSAGHLSVVAAISIVALTIPGFTLITPVLALEWNRRR